MKTFMNDKQKEYVNKRRARLLLLVDDELKTKSSNEIKINSKSFQDRQSETEEFYIVQQTFYNSLFSNDLNLPKPNSYHNLGDPYNSELKELFNNKITEEPEQDKKEIFLSEISQDQREKNLLDKSYKKLKSLAESLKITRRTYKQMLNSTKIVLKSSFKQMQLTQKPKISTSKELHNFCEFRNIILKDQRLDMKPSYELISSGLNEEFLEKFQLNVKKSKEKNTPNTLLNTNSTCYDEERNLPMRSHNQTNQALRVGKRLNSKLESLINKKNLPLSRKKTIDDEIKVYL